MTDGGKVIACGYLDTPYESVYTLNGYINSEIAGIAGDIYDAVTGGSLYEKTSYAAVAIESLFRAGERRTNFDNVLAELANLSNLADGIPGTSYIISEYTEVMTAGCTTRICELLLIDLEVKDYAILGCSSKKTAML